jgi:hypothetical protein
MYLGHDAHAIDLEKKPHMDGATSHVNPTLHMEGNYACRRNMGTHAKNEEEGILATRTVGEEIKKRRQGHEAFEEASNVPLYEGSTLSSLCATLLIMNCCYIHGMSNAFITKLLGLLKRNPTYTRYAPFF